MMNAAEPLDFTLAPPATMKAAVIAAPGEVRVVECATPQPGGGQVLVAVRACGVCASNLPRWEGRPWFDYPAAPGEMGHEGIGRIAAVGPGVANWRAGDRVSFLSNHAYAQYDVADAAAMVATPPEWGDDGLPGEPLGCAWNIFRRAGIAEGGQVAVVGLGFLGILLAQLALGEGARVIAVGRRPPGRIARDALGAADIVTGDDAATVLAEISAMTAGRLCDVVIEATGKQAPLDLAAALTRERGRLVIAGYHQDGSRQVDMQMWNWRGLDVINAHERDPAVYVEGMRGAFAAIRAGRFDPRPLLTHHLRLDELGLALDLARDRPAGFFKAIVYP